MITPQEFFEDKYNLLGLYFLIVQLIILFASPEVEYDVYLWFCNHTPLLFAFAFFTKRFQLVKALICVGFIPQLLWASDLFIKLLFDFHLFGYTERLFEINTLGVIVALVIHLFTTFIALLFTYKIPLTLESLFYSGEYVIVLYIFTIIFTTPDVNVNCVQAICGFEHIEFPDYTRLWPVYALFIIFIPMLIIQQLIYLAYFKLNKKDEDE